jgi:hypothetical protein
MNVGPMGNGRMDPKDVAILQGIGRWWKVNGESIRGSTRTPLPVQAWGETTRKRNTLYLHVFAWPESGSLAVGGLTSSVKRAYLLADAKCSPLPVKRLNSLDLSLKVPNSAPDPVDSVVVVECENEISAEPARLLLPEVSPDALRVFDAQLTGKSLKFGAGKTRDAYVEGWSSKTESVAWPVRLNEPAEFDVSANYDADPDSAGGAFAVKFGEQALKGTVKGGTNVSTSLGRVRLKPGRLEIRVLPESIQGSELMRLRSVVLTKSK